MYKTFASALVATMVACTKLGTNQLNAVTEHDAQTHELATVKIPDSYFDRPISLAQLLLESGDAASDYKAPSYNETIDMMYN